jgi:aspartyl-tRNA(Asn)/glutamyl-tRNA(Gln) amidotransferase subunit B
MKVEAVLKNGYRPVIGLEVHIQLRTKSKMFSSAQNVPGEERPNINIDEVVLGHPGTLPVANAEAIRLAVLMGLALNCTIDEWSKFDRKHYFYPDLPKGYQISQYDQPIAKEGWLEVEISKQPTEISEQNKEKENQKVVKRVLIQRAHLEEDAGKNMHPEGLAYSLVDYNRAGTPLLEIVTHPVIESAEEARKYLEELQRIARYVGASDADMEKGSMRCEPSISVRKPGQEGLPPYKVEVKNINSFKFVEQAIGYEIERQIEMLEKGDTPKQVTMGWNEKQSITVEQRSKEEANDYRYLPEPDIPPLHFTPDYILDLKNSLPELPSAKRARFKLEYGLPESDIENLLNYKELTFFFEDAVSELDEWLKTSSDQGAMGSQDDNLRNRLIKSVVNWCLQDFLQLLNTHKMLPADSKVTAENLAELVKMIADGKVSNSAGKQVFKEMFEKGGEPDHIVSDLGLEQVSDSGELEKVVGEVLLENAKIVEDYKGGKQAAFGALVGAVMKKTQGRANPQLASDLLKKQLGLV